MLNALRITRASILDLLGAALVVSFGMVLKAGTDRTLGCNTSFLFLLGGVVACAVLFNYFAAIFGIGVGALEWMYFFLRSPHTLRLASVNDVMMILLFIAVALLIVWQTHRMRLARSSVLKLISELSRHRAASATFEERDQNYRELIDGLPELVWTSGPDGQFDFLNNRWAEFTGVPVAQQLGQSWLSQAHPEDRDRVLMAWTESLKSGSGMAVEFRIRRKDGVYRWFDARARPLRDAAGRVVRWYGSNLDIEDRRRAEQFFKRLYKSHLIGIAHYQLDGKMSDPNETLLHMLGRSRADYEREGLNWRSLVAPDARDDDCAHWEKLRASGQVGPYESQLLDREGRPMPVLVSCADLEPGDHTHGMLVVVDLRRIKVAEEALRQTEAALRAANDTLERRVRDRTTELENQSERLRALALDLAETELRERKRLARMLHDHFQQLISAAKLKVGILRRRAGEQGELESFRQIETLLEEAIFASRSLATELSPPVLHDAGLAAALEWLSRWMEQNHHLRVRLDLHGWREPDADNEQIRVILFECIREVLFNVVKHAGVDSADMTARYTADGLLQIRVVDKGCGFDVHNTELKCKPDGSLGLFSIRERLVLIGGLLKVVSSPGMGTTVELTVPATFRSVAETRGGVDLPTGVPSAPPPPADRVMRVLVADDHKLFREGLISLLNQEPYLQIVGEAGDGQEALELARRLRPNILIVDVTMPKLNGIQVASIVSKELPETRIIGLSMHESDDMAEAMRDAGAVAYCAKSAPIESLVGILRNTAADHISA